MDGDERVRFCRECSRNVYNLSAMSAPEACRLVAEREGRVCVRFYQRRDGTVLTSDCPVGSKRSFLSTGAQSALAVAAIAIGSTTLAACETAEGTPLLMGKPAIESQPLMGEIAPPVDVE